jgi:hypothetical protein
MDLMDQMDLVDGWDEALRERHGPSPWSPGAFWEEKIPLFGAYQVL